jgi:methionyl-tRNA formyltransferase
MYLGVNPGAMQWISWQPFHVVAVARLDFLYGFSLNPANLLFVATYRLLCSRRLQVACRVFRLWSPLRRFATGRYKRFTPWLDSVLASGAIVVNASATETLRQAISAHRIDMLLVHGWDILPKEILAGVRYGAINVHPSRLPQYKGALPTLWALRNRDGSSCVTIQRIGSTVDGGDIIAQHPFAIGPSDTSLDFQQAVDEVTERHLYADVLGYMNGETLPRVQSGPESWTGRYESYRRVNWREESAREVVNKVLLYPYVVPTTYCYFRFRGHAAAIKGVRLRQPPYAPSPGSYYVRGITLIVGCKDAAVGFRLFLDLRLRASLWLLLNRSGELE